MKTPLSPQNPSYNQNPEQPDSPNSHIKTPSSSLLTTDDRLDAQLIRVKVQNHVRMRGRLFLVQENRLGVEMLTYQPLPYSPVSIKELAQSKTCKLIKSSQAKIYLGETYNKKKHGLGVAIYADGRAYEGHFSHNQRHGYGIQVYPNGNIYIGDFHQNKKHGTGVFFWFSLSEIPCSKNTQILIQHYKGTWWGGLPDGRGEHYRANGDVYEGEFRNGLKHGIGRETYANGDVYDGGFVNGLSEGNGTYLWKDGSEYAGDFKQGYRNGYGIWTNKHKDQTYQGHYMLDKKHGYGVYGWGNGYTYKGNYQQDQRSGQGKLMHHDEVVYQGTWVNGSKAEDVSMHFHDTRVNLFSANKTYSSMMTKSSNFLQHPRIVNSKQAKSHLLFFSKGKNSQERPYNSRQRQRPHHQILPRQPLQSSSSLTPKQVPQTFYVSFKKEEKKSYQKQRVGHRNCIPCRQVRQMKQRSLQVKKQEKQKGKSRSVRKG